MKTAETRMWKIAAGYMTAPRTLALSVLLVCLSFAPAPVSAQPLSGELGGHHGPEAQFLELVDLVAEPAKALELLDVFVGQFPKYEGMSTVRAQQQELCIELKRWDRALELGTALLAIDESDIETVRRNLKAAQGKGDSALIAKWTERLKQLEPPEGEVTTTSTVRLPFVDDDPGADLDSVDLTNIPKPQQNRIEAVLFNRALEEKDPVRKLKLLSLFERQFAGSSHIPKIRYLFFLTHLDRKDHAKALAAAEAILERDKSREDVLFYATQHYFVTKRDPAKVLAYSDLLLSLASTKQRPDHISPELWNKQLGTIVQQSHWMIGSIRFEQGSWAEADKALRASLATVEGRNDLVPGLLTRLGWANYKLGNVTEALRFYQRCAAIPGPMQQVATQSIASIKAEYNLQ